MTSVSNEGWRYQAADFKDSHNDRLDELICLPCIELIFYSDRLTVFCELSLSGKIYLVYGSLKYTNNLEIICVQPECIKSAS